MADNYYELLKHPEWQKKRLKIMERDGFKCRNCGDKERTLNVHHGYYTKGAKPWEYPDESLRTLCELCHERRHAAQAEIKECVGQLGMSSVRLAQGFIRGLMLQGGVWPSVDFGPAPLFGSDWSERVQQSLALLMAGFGLAYSDSTITLSMLTNAMGSGWKVDGPTAIQLRRDADRLRDETKPGDPPRANETVESGRSLCGDCRM